MCTPVSSCFLHGSEYIKRGTLSLSAWSEVQVLYWMFWNARSFLLFHPPTGVDETGTNGALFLSVCVRQLLVAKYLEQVYGTSVSDGAVVWHSSYLSKKYMHFYSNAHGMLTRRLRPSVVINTGLAFICRTTWRLYYCRLCKETHSLTHVFWSTIHIKNNVN